MRQATPKSVETPTAPLDGPKKSLRELAAEYEVSLNTVKRYQRNGIDVFNPEEFKAYQAVNNDKTKADKLPPKMLELKLRKLKADTEDKEAKAALSEILLAKTREQVVEIKLVEEANLAIASKVKGQLKRLSVELPSRLEGLTAPKMSAIIKNRVEEILQYLWEELRID